MEQGQRISNYEITRLRAQQLFLNYDQGVMLRRFSPEHTNEAIFFTLLGIRFRIDRQSGAVTRAETGEDAGFNEAMTILDILCCSQEGCSPSGCYTPMQNLAQVQSTTQDYAGQGMFAKQEQALDNRNAELSAALEALGGMPFGRGDVSYRIPLFLNVYAVVRFWNSDEDFPASMQLLCDENLLQYMHYETVWYMAGFLLDRISEYLPC